MTNSSEDAWTKLGPINAKDLSVIQITQGYRKPFAQMLATSQGINPKLLVESQAGIKKKMLAIGGKGTIRALKMDFSSF